VYKKPRPCDTGLASGREDATDDAVDCTTDICVGVALSLNARQRVQQYQWGFVALKCDIWDRSIIWGA
jgi:hypothetical protein